MDVLQHAPAVPWHTHGQNKPAVAFRKRYAVPHQRGLRKDTLGHGDEIEDQAMTENGNRPPTVMRRSDRGLSVAGTRITLYEIWELVLAGWPREEIRDLYRLTDDQMADVMQYIAEHKAAFDAEYRQVIADAEEDRRYWEERNRERFAQIAAMPPKPEYAAFHARVAERRANREQS